eukprot:TRINITY_DN32841_c0_g1_i2.p2 TRINITY_DN32841_c0_g1~~TRINITY_DN32841_c0_g1_i2.p2  ORF type:complete len:252 (-),score=-12.14 TRINITY_DN32841_c0_g1_i2:567-1322(-)
MFNKSSLTQTNQIFAQLIFKFQFQNQQMFVKLSCVRLCKISKTNSQQSFSVFRYDTPQSMCLRLQLTKSIIYELDIFLTFGLFLLLMFQCFLYIFSVRHQKQYMFVRDDVCQYSQMLQQFPRHSRSIHVNACLQTLHQQNQMNPGVKYVYFVLNLGVSHFLYQAQLMRLKPQRKWNCNLQNFFLIVFGTSLSQALICQNKLNHKVLKRNEQPSDQFQKCGVYAHDNYQNTRYWRRYPQTQQLKETCLLVLL